MTQEQAVHELVVKYLPLFPEDEDLPELEAAIQALILRAQIAELKTIRKNFGNLTLHEFGKGSAYSLDKRIADLQQQLKEVEAQL